MKTALGFLLGTVVGAVIGLLYAPSTGQELRTNIRTQADIQYAKLQDEWQKGMQNMQTRMDKSSSDLQTMTSHPEETGKSA